MKIILIGNYLPDAQESMSRFAGMLEAGFEDRGIECVIWSPLVVLGKLPGLTLFGIGKWIGYVDKWIIFPLVIRFRLLKNENTGSDIRFHICDHSNSPYLRHLPKDKTSLTCHDVLAIRGAFGYEDAFCPASRFGKILQKWIFNSLVCADRIAFDSQATFSQLIALDRKPVAANRRWAVIHCAFNAEFGRSDKNEAAKLTKIFLTPYLLSVGSNLERKNRKLLIDMLVGLDDQWNGNVCFAGQPASKELLEYADKSGVKDRIISVAKPDHETLLALYRGCEALIFPSFSEGFGWPVIEAQVCGAPVVASNIEPMPEVSNGTALHADPYEPTSFVDAFLTLLDPETKKRVIGAGLENAKRFDRSKMIDSYLELIT